MTVSEPNNSQKQFKRTATQSIKQMTKKGDKGFTGGMTAKKYMSTIQISKARATRELPHLNESGIMIAKGGSRNVHYEISSGD